MEKRKRAKKRRIQSKSTRSIPLDLTTEILSWMPEKSVARFRCVSKDWSSITTDAYFINMFETRSPRPSLLLCFKEGDTMFVSSISQHHQTRTLHNPNKSYSSSQPIVRYQMKFPDCSFMPPTESVHGLVCFQETATPVVWNPTKRQVVALPKPRKSWRAITVLLGHDPIEGKHKVVCFPYKRSGDVCRVLTLGSTQESWRTVKTNHKHRTDFQTCGRCIKGVVYYLAFVYQTQVWVIMSFDVRSEKFDMIGLPSDIGIPMMINYEGRFACLDINYMVCIKMWILEDAEKHKWSSKEILAPLCTYDVRLQTCPRPRLKGVTNDGELIYAPSTFCKSSYVLFCDPVRNSCRKFELKGIVDDKCRLNTGVQNALMDNALYLHAFPNHIESQMSL